MVNLQSKLFNFRNSKDQATKNAFLFRSDTNNTNLHVMESTERGARETTDRVYESMPAAAAFSSNDAVYSLDRRPERRKNVISASEATLSSIKSKILSKTNTRQEVLQEAASKTNYSTQRKFVNFEEK